MRGRRKHGFTLVEVMLTLLIMAGIMITITQILGAARRSRDRIHNMQESHLAGPAILDRVERDLRAILCFNRDPRDYLRITNRVVAGYDADSIDFVAATDSLVIQEQSSERRYVRADANEVGYRLRLNPHYDDFLEIWRREGFGIDDEPFDGGRYSFLHDRVKGFEIEVFEEDGPDAEPLEEWGTESDDNVGLPARIEIVLTLELAPRLVRESLVPSYRTVSFRRVFRFPEMLRRAQKIQPIPTIPVVTPPTPEAGGTDEGNVLTDGGGGGGGGSGAGDVPPIR